MAALTYFEVVGTYKASLLDSYDADTDPDLVPLYGRVRFTPLIGAGDVVKADTLTPPTNLLLKPIDADIKAGVVRSHGTEGVKLVDDTEVLNLEADLYYRVEFPDGLTGRGTQYQVNPFVFQAPGTGGTIDLTEVTPVTGQTAAGIIRGPRGYPIDQVGVDGDDLVFYVQSVEVGRFNFNAALVTHLPVGGFATTVGDGAATSIPIVHNLNTTDVDIEVWDVATGKTANCDKFRTDANTITLGFATAPALNSIRVKVFADSARTGISTVAGLTMSPVESDVWALTETDQAGSVSRGVDFQGRTFLKPHPDLKIGSANVGPDLPVPVEVATDGTVVFAVTDQADQAAIAVHPDGSVSIAKPSQTTLSAIGAPRIGPEPTWSSKVGSWNPEKALYNYHPTSMRKWFTALARAVSGQGTAHITAFVDSETYGAGAYGQKWSGAWPSALRRSLNTVTGYTAGTGVAVPWNTLTDDHAEDTRWNFGSSATQRAGSGQSAPNYGAIGRGALQLTNNTGNGFVEFTPTQSVTQFTIYALADSGASGTATVKVDGVSVGTFDVSAAGGGGTLTRRAGTASNVIIVDVTGLTSGAHTLRVEGPAASTVTIWGVEGGIANGVRVSNLSRSSSAVSNLVLDDATNHTYGMPLHIDTMAADLVLLMLGLNDRANSSAVFKAGCSTAIERAIAAGGDVLLIAPGQPDYTDPVVTSASLLPRVTDMYELADTYDIPLLDTTWVRGDFPTADGLGLMRDRIHSSTTGLQHHAQLIVNALTGT